MKYEIVATGRFKKDLKTMIKRRYNIQSLQDVVSLLKNIFDKSRPTGSDRVYLLEQAHHLQKSVKSLGIVNI